MSHDVHDVLRAVANLEAVHHLHRRRVDHVHVVAAQVGHVDARQVGCDGGLHLAGRLFAVEVPGVDHRRHAGHGDHGGRGRL
jgi:hypothetical protein